MVETLRKKTRKTLIFRAIFTLALAIVLLVLTKFAIVDVVLGPKTLDITKDLETYDGKYVKMDVDFFLTDFVEHTTTTTRRYGGSTTTVNGNSYIAYEVAGAGEGATLYFFSVYMSRGDEALMEGKMKESWERLDAGQGRTPSTEPMEVRGTWMKMDAQLERYFRETMAELGVKESDLDRLCFYTLDSGRIGGQKTFAFWAMTIVALISLLIFVLSLVGIFGNGYLGNINKYLQVNTSASMDAIEADFAQAHVIGKDTWIGQTWTVYRQGAKAYILQNRDLIWGYYFRRTGRNSVSEMRLYTIDKKIEHISMSESETKEALQYYAAEQPQIIVGYSADLEKTWQKDFSGFLEIRYNPAQRG